MIVTTQEELDAAVAAGETEIIIDSPAGVWLTVKGSSTVAARGSSTVTARDSSTVAARGLSTVTAWDSSTVTAWDSSTVAARGLSTVTAWGSSTVTAWDSSTVTARDSSTVTAWDLSTVTARGSSTVTARDSSTVTASKYVAVHLHSARATVTGWVVIDITALDLTHLTDWADYHGAKIVGDEVIVYKAVDADLRSGRGFEYPVGETVTCPDWDPVPECGGGLHLSPHPAQARDYYRGAARFLRCAVPVDALTIIDGDATYMTPKLKARTVRVLCEVDVHGIEINKEN